MVCLVLIKLLTYQQSDATIKAVKLTSICRGVVTVQRYLPRHVYVCSRSFILPSDLFWIVCQDIIESVLGFEFDS